MIIFRLCKMHLLLVCDAAHVFEQDFTSHLKLDVSQYSYSRGPEETSRGPYVEEERVPLHTLKAFAKLDLSIEREALSKHDGGGEARCRQSFVWDLRGPCGPLSHRIVRRGPARGTAASVLRVLLLTHA